MKEKKHVLLGFKEEESNKIVEKLNELLANLQIHYQKLRNYHWNVVGPDFFDLHETFEEEYNAVKIEIDEVAERIRVFGKTPYSTLTDYIENARIKETGTDLSADEMVQEILRDFENLLSYMIEVVDYAGEIGDTSTDDLITGYMKRKEKMHWMLTSFSK